MAKRLLVLFCILVVLIAFGFAVGTFDQWPFKSASVACTMEAMQCPDGSYVGRTGPQCEFSPCLPASGGPGASSTASAALLPSISEGGSIKVIQPQPNIVIGNPLVIQGEARVYHGLFSYRLLDNAGNQIAGGFSAAQQTADDHFGPFKTEIAYQALHGRGTVEVYTRSPQDGSIIDIVTIPIQFAE